MISTGGEETGAGGKTEKLYPWGGGEMKQAKVEHLGGKADRKTLEEVYCYIPICGVVDWTGFGESRANLPRRGKGRKESERQEATISQINNPEKTKRAVCVRKGKGGKKTARGIGKGDRIPTWTLRKRGQGALASQRGPQGNKKDVNWRTQLGGRGKF